VADVVGLGPPLSASWALSRDGGLIFPLEVRKLWKGIR
jgi:hypothetical protein